MPISISCSCGRQLKLRSKLAGRLIRCPECEAELRVSSQTDSRPKRQKSEARTKTRHPESSGRSRRSRPTAERSLRPAGTVSESEHYNYDSNDMPPRRTRPRKKRKRPATSAKLIPVVVCLVFLSVAASVVVLVGPTIMEAASRASNGGVLPPESPPESHAAIGRWLVDFEQTESNATDSDFRSLLSRSKEAGVSIFTEVKANGVCTHRTSVPGLETNMKKMANRAGLTVQSGGKHLRVFDKAGNLVTTIPNSPHAKGTIKGIVEAIMGAAGF